MEMKFETTKRGSKDFTDVQEHTWNLDEQLDVNHVLSQPEFLGFKKAATIVSADCASGFQIKLTPDFENKPFVIYIVVKSGKVLKGGKSKNSLDTRSYAAGTEETWTMRGTCSETNYIWSQIFRKSLEDNEPIEFYGFVVPSVPFTYTSFDGTSTTTYISPYEEEEKKLNAKLNKMNGKKVIGEGKLSVQEKK